MSQQTLTWLNQNTLIGFTEQRGKAWHYRASAQGGEPNHYAGPIPVEDVHRRLFWWDAAKGEATATWLTDDGVTSAIDRRHFPVGRPDTGVVFGYFAEGYEIHQFREWLVGKVATMLDGGLQIGSAGLLNDGAQAWVSIEIPDTVTTPQGVPFRPHLLACTSHDGSLATTYKRTVTNVVCDNTMSTALAGTGQVAKFRHSRNSKFKALEAREALDLVQATSDDFSAEIRRLCEIEVSDRDFDQFLRSYVQESGTTRRSRTTASNKRDKLRSLWNHDERAAPWRGTAWGVLQATNTYQHHTVTVRSSATRAERNYSRALNGRTDQADMDALKTLGAVLDREVLAPA